VSDNLRLVENGFLPVRQAVWYAKQEATFNSDPNGTTLRELSF
jgi:hypothetical protein